MKTTTAQQLVEFTAEQLQLHYGPGPHKDGSPQTIHGGGAGPRPTTLRKRGNQRIAQRRVTPTGEFAGDPGQPKTDQSIRLRNNLVRHGEKTWRVESRGERPNEIWIERVDAGAPREIKKVTPAQIDSVLRETYGQLLARRRKAEFGA